jgi:4-amino-4-deoxy-L-arabinose transferase-like glycosyltransferase
MSTTQLTRWQRFIVLAHVALAVLFGVIVPPWEAHDETGHFAYVNQLVTDHSLPDARSNQKVFLDQSHQPPLYYFIVAGLTFWIDRSDQLTPQTNLFAFDGTNRRGTRILLRSRGEDFPWTGTILALHAARLVSALLSGLMILLIARTARRLFRDMPSAALLATATAAFNPQVLFMAGMVNNDVMVSLAGAALIYLIVSLMRSDDASPALPALRRCALVGVALALGLWSKNSALILIPFTGLALTFLAWREHWPLKCFFIRGIVTGLATGTISLPLYLSNYLRYGQWLVDRAAENKVFSAPSAIGAGLAVSLRDKWLPQVFINAFNTFWGTFGWGNVQMPGAIYTLIAILTLIGVIGAVFGLRRASRSVQTGLALMIMLGIAMMLLPGYRAIYYQDPALLPGRYLMPALAAYAGILGFGWAILGLEIGDWRLLAELRNSKLIVQITKTKDQRLETDSTGANSLISNPKSQIPFRETPFSSLKSKMAEIQNLKSKIAVVLLALFALWVPFAYIAPAYALPHVTHTGNDTPALLTFEDVAQVTAVDASSTYLNDREGARQYAHVRLTWRALQRTDKDYAFSISILGRDAQVLGNLNVQPARGNYPSTNWNAGDTFDDDYYILLEKPCASLPTLGHVSISVYEFQQVSGNDTTGISVTHQLQARDGEGRPVSPIIGRFKIEAPANPIPAFWEPPLGMMDNIALRYVNMPASIAAGSTFGITLTYETWRGVTRRVWDLFTCLMHMDSASLRMITSLCTGLTPRICGQQVNA